ncbi:MAG TPA: DUF72 domain-containing protein [Armatimonadota bacterium]|jgi:uncharacterized protein YecE (DUF72 family)
MEPLHLGSCSIYVGTCSWKDHTRFFPEKLPDPQKIAFYAEHFPFVEVDSTYYGMPSARNAVLWAERTPPGFLFGFKAYRVMTLQGRHEDGRRVPEEPTPELFQQFSEGVRPLQEAGKLAYVLLQFPDWFLPWKQNAKAREPFEYLAACAEWLPGLPLAVEFRNGYWFQGERAEQTLRFLSDHNLAYTVVDEPQVGVSRSAPDVQAVTSELSVMRFHGRRTDVWAQRGVGVADRFSYDYSTEELQPWADRLAALARETKHLFVGFNNCHHDFAVNNAKQLMQMLLDL